MGFADLAAVTIDEINFVIENQIYSSPYLPLLNINAPAPMQLSDSSGLNGGGINFVPVSNNVYDLSNLGFASDNRNGDGIADIEANNQFHLDILGFSSFEVLIPPATYATVDDLAAAIQFEVEAYAGPEQLGISSVTDRLIFTNKQLGSAYSISIEPSYSLLPEIGAAALAALKLDNIEVFLGVDENPAEPRYLPGQYIVDVIAKNATGTRSGSATYSFEVNAN
ncbi:MAG: hypothetical protein V7785_18565 [Bermanella sp.]